MPTIPQRGIARRAAAACLTPVLERAARAYVAGETAVDARRAAARWALRGLPCTLGFWNGEDQSPREVADHYLAGIDGMAPPDYVSIKATALDYSPDLLAEVAGAAARANIRLHFDAMWPDSVEPAQRAVDRLLARPGCPPLGWTLPARWRRSLSDAGWALERRLPVRVVKGQWADPSDPSLDLRAAYLGLIDALAGRAALVAVASHDVPMTSEALRRLRANASQAELELLHGLPTRDSLKLSAAAQVPPRIYVGYGKAHLPYAVARVIDNPHMIWWLAKDLVATLSG